MDRARMLSVIVMVWGWCLLVPFSIEASQQDDKNGSLAIGQLVDIAEFGKALSGERFIGVEWENLREIRRVSITFPEGTSALPVDNLRLEWWGSVWPNVGVGTYQPGWLQKDDHWNGQWVRVDTKAEKGPDANTWEFTFPPLTKKEWKKALPKQIPSYRGTLKVRVASEGEPMPEGARISVFGESRWSETSFDIRLRGYKGQFDVINGKLLSISKWDNPFSEKIDSPLWESKRSNSSTVGVRIKVLYADNANPHSNDLTRVTVRKGGAHSTGFSFVPQQVLKEGIMRVPTMSAVIIETGREMPQEKASADWERPVRLRIRERPETTYESAMAGIPRLSPPMWVPMGVPSARQEVFISALGDWAMWWPSLNTEGRDSKRCLFRQPKKGKKGRDQPGLYMLMDTRDVPKFDGKDREGMKRYLEEECLPVFHAQWRTGPIHYHNMMATTILLGDIGDDVGRRGDETVVFLAKMEVRNTSDTPAKATFNLRYSHGAPLSLEVDGIIAIHPRVEIPADLVPLRGQVSVDRADGGDIEGWTVMPSGVPGTSQILRWQATLDPGQTRTLYFKQPYVDLLDKEEYQRFKEINYDEEVPKVVAYWHKRMAGGMQIDVQSPALNHFYAANLWHNLITTDRDPKTGLYNQFVGTWGYKVFANETVMIARSMDMRGEHVEAERFLEPMLHFQGSEPLTGNFSTKKDVFHGAGAYTHGRYAMNHGFVLWGIADHYLFTRDRAYLERVAPQLVKGCDFLMSERKATMAEPFGPDNRVYGLAPACALEDITEFKYWFATNSYFYLGMKRVARALADIGHPEAQRISEEAEAYRCDIKKALGEATARAAVVRLRDGTYIPQVPPRAYQWQHLTGGWVREALYCSLHAASAGVIRPGDWTMTWMLDELEDNIFFSRSAGFGLKDVDKYWFERGAVTKQPCLLDTPIIYMARDEIKAALRSFWNTYALLIYPDIQALAEWATNYGKPGGPFYKTSDESRFIMWFRQLLIWESGDRLYLARAAPRTWLEDGKTIRVERAPTFFGTMSMSIRSEADSGCINAKVTLPSRNPPEEVWLRLRHPQGKKPERVFINDRQIDSKRIVGEDIRIVPGVRVLPRPIEIRAEYAK